MVFLHAMTGQPESTLEHALQAAVGAEGQRPLVGPFREPAARLSGPQGLLDNGGLGLPEGAAKRCGRSRS